MQTQKLITKIQKSYPKFLKSEVDNSEFSLIFSFPKISIKGNEHLINQAQFELKKLSDKYEGFLLNTKKTQKGTIIESVEFKNKNSYLEFIGKTKNYKEFGDNLDIIKYDSLSNLLFLQGDFNTWLVKNISKININTGKWKDILKVVSYFILNQKSNLYFRELPIKVHSKFIENNKSIIQDILNFLTEKLDLGISGNSFEEKFGIKTKPEFIRFRFLDMNLKQNYFSSSLDDLYLTIQNFSELNISQIKNVFIIENEINYLTFPKNKDSIVIWGAGFSVGKLKNIGWLNDKKIFYWGDLDSHGFKILSICRRYYSQTESIFMDKTTYDAFEKYKCVGKTLSVSECEKIGDFLNSEEKGMLDFLNENNLRLEQENVSQKYVEENLK